MTNPVPPPTSPNSGPRPLDGPVPVNLSSPQSALLPGENTMTLSTLYAFLGHDLLGNTLAAALITGIGYTAKKIRAKVRNRNGNTDHTNP